MIPKFPWHSPKRIVVRMQYAHARIHVHILISISVVTLWLETGGGPMGGWETIAASGEISTILEVTWAIKKNQGCLGYSIRIILPSYMGIIKTRYEESLSNNPVVTVVHQTARHLTQSSSHRESSQVQSSERFHFATWRGTYGCPWKQWKLFQPFLSPNQTLP